MREKGMRSCLPGKVRAGTGHDLVVDLAAVPDVRHDHESIAVLKPIKNPIVRDAHPVQPAKRPPQGDVTALLRRLREPMQGPDDAFSVLAIQPA
jgi:hypothetical protein